MDTQAKTRGYFRVAVTPMITAGQLRLARILLRMSQKEFASAASVSEQTIQRLERMPAEQGIDGYSSTIKKIEKAFQNHNVVFVEGGAAIRKKKK